MIVKANTDFLGMKQGNIDISRSPNNGRCQGCAMSYKSLLIKCQKRGKHAMKALFYVYRSSAIAPDHLVAEIGNVCLDMFSHGSKDPIH